MSQNGSTWGAQVDSALDRELEEYRENVGLSKSETVRKLLREGLNDGQARWYQDTLDTAAGVLTAGAVLFAVLFVADLTGSAIPGPIALITFSLAFLTIFTNAWVYHLKT